jgi:hypothetical protein
MTAMGLALAALCALGPAQQKGSVEIYVFAATPPGETDNEAAAARAEAVRDMKDALGRKAGLEIVEDRAAADVVVEVLGRESREPPGGFGGLAVTRMGDTIIRVRVRSGDQETELKGLGQGTWGRAARDAADRILKWIARLQRKAVVATDFTDDTD